MHTVQVGKGATSFTDPCLRARSGQTRASMQRTCTMRRGIGTLNIQNKKTAPDSIRFDDM